MSTAVARPGNTPSGTPDDAALPGAALLQQPRRLVEVLSPLLTGGRDVGGRLVTSRVAIRRYVPGKRCIAELELVIAPGTAGSVEVRTVIGKLYAGGEGARVYDTLHRLWASGFSSGPFSVPRPLAYEPNWQLLLLSRVTGTALRQLLLASPALPALKDRQEDRPDTLAHPSGVSAVSTAVERSAAGVGELHKSGGFWRGWGT